MQPNILFIVLDALPAHRCYGKNKTSRTPSIDTLIERGVSFEQTISSADGTRASFGSLFTGKFPFNGAIRGGLELYKYKPNINNYIRILKNHGYHAYATSPNLTSMKEIFSEFENDDYPFFGYRLYNGLGEQILKKLETKVMKEPWIYMLHLMDTHKPISYPNKFDYDECGKDEYDRMISSVDFWIGKIIEKINFEKTIIIITADHGDYIRSIERNNKRLSFEYKVLASPALKISKMTPDFLYPLKIKTFLFVRSMITKIKLMKLGRKLTPYEKRVLNNSRSEPNHFLFDDVIRVPLIISGYNISSVGPIKQQVRTIDIFPTIMEIIGIPKNDGVDGRSLVSLINGKRLDDLPAYIETSINVNNVEEGGYGIRTSKYKFFRRVPDNDKRLHLYDLKKDPLEENNIAFSRPELVEEMEDLILKIKGASNEEDNLENEKINDTSEEEEEKIRDELKKMGYIR